MTLKSLFAALAFTLTSVALVPAAHAEKPPVYTGFLSNVAVGGHDPVAYFTDGRPVKGERAFSTTYQGAEFRFASQENLDRFLADPKAYAPAYGGYCAWAVSQGYTAKGDPDIWTIVDGRLYLNFNRQVQADWEQDIPGFIASADANWPSVLE